MFYADIFFNTSDRLLSNTKSLVVTSGIITTAFLALLRLTGLYMTFLMDHWGAIMIDIL